VLLEVEGDLTTTQTAYRQLLLRHEIKELDNGNCSFDGVQILHTSSKSVDNSSEVNTDVEINPEEIDEDIILSTFYELTHYVEGVVDYIAGFVAKKLKTKFECHICIQNLEGSDEEMPLLKKIKKQRFPKNAINGCCIYLQNRRKIYQAPRYKKNYMHNIMTTKIFNVVENSVFLADTKEKHRAQLINSIIKCYLNVRFFYEAKKTNSKPSIHQKYTKAVLFKGQ
jgi:hypothetical protein